jgi:TP901-1 family phage major tail protein
MVAQRPKFKNTSEKLLGKNVLVFLNYGESATEETPKWALIGGQRSADYSASAEEIDLTDKTSGGYGDTEAGVKTTELTVELIVKPAEEAVKELWKAFEADEPVHILRWSKNGRSVMNWYSITSMEETAAHDDAAVLSVTLKGKGAPKAQDAMEDPRG